MEDGDSQESRLLDALFTNEMSYAECCADVDLTFSEDMSDENFVCRALVEESLGNVDQHDLPGMMSTHGFVIDLVDDADDDLGPFCDDDLCCKLVHEAVGEVCCEVPIVETDVDGSEAEELPHKQPRRRHSHLRAERFGIAPQHYRNLRRYCAPLALFHLLAHIRDMNHGPIGRDLWMADMYAGEGAVSKAFRSAGFAAAEFEIRRSRAHMDMLTPTGLMVATILGLRLAPGGLSSWGTVCTSFIFVSQPQCQRTPENPLGNLQRSEVRAGNQMVSRMVMVIMLILVRGGQWLLEQPGSSRMAWVPRLQWLLSRFDNHVARTWMGAFGGPTWKPTILRSSSAWVHLMHRALTDDDKKRCQDQTTCKKHWDPIRQKWHVSGKLKELKESQVYPLEYGMAMFDFWKRHTDLAEHIKDDDDASSSDSDGYVENEVPEIGKT